MKEFFRMNKVYVVVIGCLLIYLVIFMVIGIRVRMENSKYASVIVDGVNIWEYKDSKWRVVGEEELDNESNSYKLYSSNQYYGDYTVKVNDKKLYAFDSKYNSFQYEDTILAVNSNYDINVYSFDYYDIDDRDMNILNGVINNSYEYDIRKIVVNVNKDQFDEYFYVIDYYDNGDKYFSEIYYYDTKLREVIKNDGSRYNSYDIEYILDINNDGSYEIILSSTYYNMSSYKIYKLDRKDFVLFLE